MRRGRLRARRITVLPTQHLGKQKGQANRKKISRNGVQLLIGNSSTHQGSKNGTGTVRPCGAGDWIAMPHGRRCQQKQSSCCNVQSPQVLHQMPLAGRLVQAGVKGGREGGACTH